MSHDTNFLHKIEPEFVHKHHRRRRIIRKLFLFLGIVFVIWLIVAALALVHVFSKTFEARDALLSAKEYALELSFEEGSNALSSAQDSLESASKAVSILETTRILPLVGSYADQFTDLVRSGHEVVEALGPLFDLGQDLIQLSGISQEYLLEMRDGIVPSITFEDLPSETKRVILTRLSAAADDMDLLVARINIAEQELALITQESNLGPLLSLLDPLTRELQKIESELSLLSVAARVLPTFGGLDGPSNNLLLFLNNNELRPGGGFIGSYGILETQYGDIAQLETSDVYTLDDAVADRVETKAPDPLQRYNATTQLFFRDSNWSPDFATSSQDAIEQFLYEVGLLSEDQRAQIVSATRIDNVIAMTPVYASSLLDITGPITVSGQTFTSENVPDLIEYQVQLGFQDDGLPYTQRKEILADLVNEMKSVLFMLPLSEWEQVVVATEEALRTRQLLLYSSNQDTESVLTAVGWGGRMQAQTADVQFVVDANMASLKSDPVVTREIEYSISRNDEGSYIGTTSITYNNTGDFDYKTTRYRTYTRLYAPVGTQLIIVNGSLVDDLTNNPSGAAGPVDIGEDLGMAFFGAFTAVEPGATQTLTFEYTLAQSVVEAINAGVYQLSFLKQNGARDHALTLRLDFDKNVTHAYPPEAQSAWGDALYELSTILDQDIQVDVRL